MYLLDDVINFCGNDFLPLWRVVGTIMKALWIGIPGAVVVLGTIDLGKAVISSKEDEVKDAKKAFIRRLIYAALAFCVVWFVGLVIKFVTGIGVTKGDTNGVSDVDTGTWACCWKMAIKGKGC